MGPWSDKGSVEQRQSGKQTEKLPVPETHKVMRKHCQSPEHQMIRWEAGAADQECRAGENRSRPAAVTGQKIYITGYQKQQKI